MNAQPQFDNKIPIPKAQGTSVKCCGRGYKSKKTRKFASRLCLLDMTRKLLPRNPNNIVICLNKTHATAAMSGIPTCMEEMSWGPIPR